MQNVEKFVIKLSDPKYVSKLDQYKNDGNMVVQIDLDPDDISSSFIHCWQDDTMSGNLTNLIKNDSQSNLEQYEYFPDELPNYQVYIDLDLDNEIHLCGYKHDEGLDILELLFRDEVQYNCADSLIQDQSNQNIIMVKSNNKTL